MSRPGSFAVHTQTTKNTLSSQQIIPTEQGKPNKKMVTKSKLRLALAAEKGVDFAKLKQQKKTKEATKRKALQAGSTEREGEDEGTLDQPSATTADNEIEEDQEKVGIEFHSESLSPSLTYPRR